MGQKSQPPAKKIERNEIHLWLIDQNKINRTDVLQHYPLLISNDETQRMGQFRSPVRQNQFLISRAALRSILCMYMPHRTPPSLTFSQNAWGKPELTDNPHNLQFNVSHSKDKVLIGVTKARCLGVDIEYMNHARDFKKIAENYFHTLEWHDDAFQHDDELGTYSATRFYKLWTLKEALTKAEGKGLALPFDSFYFRCPDNQPAKLMGDSSACLFTKQWGFHHQYCSDNYSLAIAFEELAHNEVTRIVNMDY